MIDARRGDVDGGCDGRTGCANGIYFMTFNILARESSDPDPVFQLRDQFDEWRMGLIGVPDAAASRLTLSTDNLENDGQSTATLTIEVLDWQGLPATGVLSVAAVHDWEGSARSSSIGPVEDLGNGAYSVTLTAGTTLGQDNIVVVAQRAEGPTILTPDARLLIRHPLGDLNGDGELDGADIDPFFLALSDADAFRARFPAVAFEKVGDINQDGVFDGADVDAFFELLVRG